MRPKEVAMPNPTKERQKVEQIVKGLTEAQKRLIEKGNWPEWQREYREHRSKCVLERKGICTFTHLIAGRGDWLLTPTGLAVRSLIQENGK